MWALQFMVGPFGLLRWCRCIVLQWLSQTIPNILESADAICALYRTVQSEPSPYPMLRNLDPCLTRCTSNSSILFAIWLAQELPKFRYKKAISHLSYPATKLNTSFANYQDKQYHARSEIISLLNMQFSSALLVLASAFIVGSNALNMFVSLSHLPSSDSIAYVVYSHTHTLKNTLLLT